MNVLRHKVCGGAMTKTGQVWRCGGCIAVWSASQFDNMPFAYWHSTFGWVWESGPVAEKSEDRYTLEWVTEGKRRFSRLRKL